MEPGTPAPAGGARAVAGNGLWLLAGQLVAKLAGLVFVVIVARALGVREYGWFVLATSIVPLALSFGQLGLDSVVVREVVRDRDRLSQVFASGLAVRVGAGTTALLVSVLVTRLLVPERLAVLTAVVVGAALLLDEITTYLSNVFKAFERMRFHATALMVNRIASTLLAAAAYALDAGLTAILVTYLLGSIGALLYCVVSLRRHFPPIGLREARRSTATQLLRLGLPLGVASVLNMALLRLNAMVVQALEGSASLGLYGVAFRFFESFLFVSWTLGSLTLPRYARHGAGAASARTFELALAAALAFYVPLFVVTLFASAEAVTWLFGERYAPAAPAVPWFTGAAVLYAVTFQARNACVGVGGRGAIARIAAVALVLNVGLSLVLVPRHGFVGAAAATAAAAGVEAGLSLLAARRLGVPVRPTRVLSVPIAAGAVMVGALAVSGLEGGPAAAAGAAAYGLALAGLTALLAPATGRRAVALLRRRAPAGGDGP